MTIQDRVQDAMAVLGPSCSLPAIDTVLRDMFSGAFTVGGYGTTHRAAPDLYIRAVAEGFYSSKTQVLPSRDRECALVALLASQGADTNLALHLFIALAAGVPVDDVIDLLFLAGVYCGANVLTTSLRVATKTFEAIIQAAADGVQGPRAVFRAIAARFPDRDFDLARERLLTNT